MGITRVNDMGVAEGLRHTHVIDFRTFSINLHLLSTPADDSDDEDFIPDLDENEYFFHGWFSSTSDQRIDDSTLDDVILRIFNINHTKIT